MYELARGPLALGASLIFLFGLVYQAVRFFQLTRAVRQTNPGYRPQPRGAGSRHPSQSIQRTARIQRTVLGMEPTMVAITAIFHAALVLTPLTLLAHALLIDDSWGIRLPAFPEVFSDFLTVLVLLLGGFLLYRRIVLARVRAITGPVDILLLVVVLFPFLTGFLAYHQWLPYRPMILAHIIGGEIMLVCIPFTRLSHALFFFLTRLNLGGEYSFTRGKRTWR